MQVRVYKKVSRNDPCPCGSGLKLKRCECKDQEVKDDKVDKLTRAVTRDGKIVGNWEKK